MAAFVMKRLVIAVLVAAVLMAGDRAAAGPRVFDPVSGADVRRYPPDCPVDFTELTLRLDFERLEDRAFAGSATYTLRPVHADVRTLTLDAVDLRIDAVAAPDGPAIDWRHDGGQIHIAFASPLPAGQDTRLVIDYRCVEPIYGMVWAVPDEGYPDRPLIIHTQGEAEFSRYWFPCLDYPVDRLSTEMIVTIPRGYHAISNGRLMEVKEEDGADRRTFHYRQFEPHVCYLVSLVIGDFDRVEANFRHIPIEYFAPRGQGPLADLTYKETPRMMRLFSDLLAADYPFAKYSQVNVPLFYFGGMENTSATTMADTLLLTPRAALDQHLEGLIAHELAHQWFGDLITCRGWRHIWLNEGFATFMESVWTEAIRGREEYLYRAWKRFASIADADRAGEGEGLLHDAYEWPMDCFSRKGSLVYSKGAAVLHMLRAELGDELFWAAVRKYVETHRYALVETDEVRRVFEKVSGRSLVQFFEQWVMRPGVPHLKIDYEWSEVEGLVRLTVEQTQTISAASPAFAVPLHVMIRTPEGETSRTLQLDERREVIAFPAASPPSMVCIDPYAALLSRIEFAPPRAMLIAQLEAGPTAVSRCAAAAALAKDTDPAAVAALSEAVRRTGGPWFVRVEAAEALGAMNTPAARDALLALLADRIVSGAHQVRRAMVSALRRYDTAEVGEALATLARSDPSSLVEAEATRALGEVLSFDATALLIENTGKESYTDQIRIAALEALTAREAPEAIDVLLTFGAYGKPERTRPVAIRGAATVARAHRHRRDEVRRSLVEWLRDPQDRSVSAAIGGLATLADSASLDALRRFLDSAIKPHHRLEAEDALRTARAEDDGGVVRKLGERIEQLQKRIEELYPPAEKQR